MFNEGSNFGRYLLTRNVTSDIYFATVYSLHSSDLRLIYFYVHHF